ncbi:MAG: TRAP transporter large permease [Deltaproteobacteria bacterium]|nr:TRAP transporter large permease [Deltaproteobacteria bacterium]MBM4340738.1 TRAP transporter large permease [Deltaproteobacteria bacterium]
MSPELTGIVGIGLFFVVLAFKMQIGLSMLFVGLLGFAYLSSPKAMLAKLGMDAFASASVHALSVIPLFVLMGLFLFHAGLGHEIYKALYAWIGRVRGGLGMATIGACGVFGALSGSIIATVATFTAVALPEMRRYKYKDIFSTACIAAGGGVDILIPPSTVLVLYGILTYESIGKLLIGGIVPGILLAFLFIGTIYVWVRINPSLAPLQPRERITIFEKFKLSAKLYPVAVLFLIAMGGIYLGVFTPTEAAAVGAFGALIFSLVTRQLTREGFKNALSEAASVTGMLFLILIGAGIFGRFITISKIPMQLAAFVSGLDVSPYVILVFIYLFYILLGCFVEGLAVLALTVPVLYPLVTSLGFDGVWFGIIVIIMVSIGTITPPVGICVYVTAGVAKDVPLGTIFKGAVPFWIAKIILATILTIFPKIVTFLPSLMK